mgnify:CR=1 FL=1
MKKEEYENMTESQKIAYDQLIKDAKIEDSGILFLKINVVLWILVFSLIIYDIFFN